MSINLNNKTRKRKLITMHIFIVFWGIYADFVYAAYNKCSFANPSFVVEVNKLGYLTIRKQADIYVEEELCEIKSNFSEKNSNQVKAYIDEQDNSTSLAENKIKSLADYIPFIKSDQVTLTKGNYNYTEEYEVYDTITYKNGLEILDLDVINSFVQEPYFLNLSVILPDNVEIEDFKVSLQKDNKEYLSEKELSDVIYLSYADGSMLSFTSKRKISLAEKIHISVTWPEGYIMRLRKHMPLPQYNQKITIMLIMFICYTIFSYMSFVQIRKLLTIKNYNKIYRYNKIREEVIY